VLSKTYSGMLDVTATKRLHYMFIESQRTPATDAIVVWFNGGPGCSSLLGMMQEHGPFVINDNSTEII
jgi:cathepsin A (carboxypeptidase C)